MAPRPGGEARQLDQAYSDAGEFGDGMADLGHHAPDLPVTTLKNGQLDLGIAGFTGFGRGPDDTNALGRLRQAVRQDDTLPQSFQRLRRRDAQHFRPVGFRHVVTRVGQLEQEITVVGQENQAFRGGIQAPDRAQHDTLPKIYQIRDQPPGMGVPTGRHDAARLVQRDVVAPARRTDCVIIKQDTVRLQIHLRPKFSHHTAVNADAALRDPHLARSARADPGGGERLLQPFDHKVSFLPHTRRPYRKGLRRP